MQNRHGGGSALGQAARKMRPVEFARMLENQGIEREEIMRICRERYNPHGLSLIVNAETERAHQRRIKDADRRKKRCSEKIKASE
jgi:hypothetical protein